MKRAVFTKMRLVSTAFFILKLNTRLLAATHIKGIKSK